MGNILIIAIPSIAVLSSPLTILNYVLDLDLEVFLCHYHFAIVTKSALAAVAFKMHKPDLRAFISNCFKCTSLLHSL